jgi:hypothetical protein
LITYGFLIDQTIFLSLPYGIATSVKEEGRRKKKNKEKKKEKRKEKRKKNKIFIISSKTLVVGSIFHFH